MKLSILDLRLIIGGLERLHNDTPEDLEHQRVRRSHCKELISICRSEILDIEAMKIE